MKKKDGTKGLYESSVSAETGVKPADAGQENGESRLPSWEQVLAIPEYRAAYDRSVQDIVRRRLRNSREAESSLERLLPVLDALGRRYNVDTRPESIDAGALAALILKGVGKIDQETDRVLRHLESLMAQEAELQERFPEFELMAALEDPGFVRLTAPHTGLGLMDAYCALHSREIADRAARESLEALSRSLRSGAMRPRELGGMSAGSAFNPDPGSLSRQQRQALKKRIYEAAVLGAKVYPE